MTRTYWHIAHPSWSKGDDLVCRNRQPEPAEWAWGEADEGFDGDVVCLFPDTPRGRTEADWLWSERPDHNLLRVEVPADAEMTTVEEGYPAINGSIPGAWITLICTGYAEQVVCRDGDEY